MTICDDFYVGSSIICKITNVDVFSLFPHIELLVFIKHI